MIVDIETNTNGNIFVYFIDKEKGSINISINTPQRINIKTFIKEASPNRKDLNNLAIILYEKAIKRFIGEPTPKIEDIMFNVTDVIRDMIVKNKFN